MRAAGTHGEQQQPRPDAARISRGGERGASAVELAIVLSILLLFVFGTIQVGIAFNRNQGLQASAREGARVASVGGYQSDIKARVQQAESLFDPNDILVRIEYSKDNGQNYSGQNGGTICDDGNNSNKCTSTTGPSPCGVAGVANLIRVTATVPGALNKYGIIIPLWGNAQITFSADGVFRCEESN